MSVLNLLTGGLSNLVLGVLDRVKLNPEEKAKVELALASQQHEIAKMEMELEAKLADSQGQNIRAEAQSGDKFTSRARPTFLYICNAILSWNYIVVPLLNKTPIELPEPLFWLFGSVMLGYVGARSWEKIYKKGE